MRPAMALIVGLLLGFGIVPASAEPKGTGRLIVGLKEPATPKEVRQLEKALPVTILRVGAGGVYLLVRPEKGATPAAIRAAAPARIAYVEPEIVMGAAFRTREAP